MNSTGLPQPGGLRDRGMSVAVLLFSPVPGVVARPGNCGGPRLTAFSATCRSPEVKRFLLDRCGGFLEPAGEGRGRDARPLL
jgi:hypothetical protein